MPRHWRPDRSGVILTGRGMYKGHLVVVMSAIHAGGTEGRIAQSICEQLRLNKYIVVASDGVKTTLSYTHCGIPKGEGPKIALWLDAHSKKEEENQQQTNEGFTF